VTYIQGDMTKPDLYEQVRSALDKAEKAHGTRGNAIFYLAIADLSGRQPGTERSGRTFDGRWPAWQLS